MDRRAEGDSDVDAGVAVAWPGLAEAACDGAAHGPPQRAGPRREGSGELAAGSSESLRRVEDELDVPVGVVVGEDRLAPVARGPGGLQVTGRAGDGVGRVHDVAAAVVIAVEAVRRPGAGHELHRPESTRRARSHVLAMA